MRFPSIQNSVVQWLTEQFRSGKLSSGQIGVIVVVFLLCLYAILLVATGRLSNVRSNATEMPSDLAGATSLDTDPSRAAIAQGTPGTIVEETNEDTQTLSNSFLAEYDRIAAEENVPERVEAPQSATETSSLVGTFALSLLLIAGLIYGVVWGLRRLGGRQDGSALLLGSHMLAVQESQDLGPNQKLHLVRMGDELLLLGATEQNISCLARYAADQAPETFAEHLQAATKTADPSGQTATGLENPIEPPSDLFQERMQQLRQLQQAGRKGATDAS